MSLLGFERQFSNLRLNIRGGERSPHEVAMLLAVIDLIEDGTITKNRIYFRKPLKSAFTRHFKRLARPNDRNNPHLPFFHLRSSSFWHHHLKPGRADIYNALSTATGSKVITDNIAFAYLDDELFELLGYGVARALLKSSLLRNLNKQDYSEILGDGTAWNWLECEVTVRDYFAMLDQELHGQRYNKAEHRRRLVPQLSNRSEGSVEFKHQNISAILVEMGLPYIQGYRPRFNYQQQLGHVILAYMAEYQDNVESITQVAEATGTPAPTQADWDKVLDRTPPGRIASVREPEREYLRGKVNYAEREHNNRQLGEQGEAFVIEFERYRLSQSGRPDLAKEVEWSSNERGDGLGYDVRSFNPCQDEELFIEVKTTNSGKHQPFFISENEVAFSKECANQFSLYRVYDFRKYARIFQLEGAVNQHVLLQPQIYKASFRTAPPKPNS